MAFVVAVVAALPLIKPFAFNWPLFMERGFFVMNFLLLTPFAKVIGGVWHGVVKPLFLLLLMTSFVLLLLLF